MDKFKNHIKNNPYATTIVSNNHKPKFIFMKIGRTAGTAIHNTIGRHHEEVSLPYFLKSGHSNFIENYINDKNIKEYFIFTFTRNPFERLISAWKAFVRKGRASNNFKEFIKIKGSGHWLKKDGEVSNDHWLPQEKYVEYSNKEQFANFIGKFENLEEDWKIVSKKIGIKSNIKVTANNSKNYRSFYTDELKEIVSNFYKRDLELFNYKF